MSIVGRVGSLISQGVYSVATPFHPFGGAVDVIVVQQQDGTFRSTPWYVRFGKFQGVLKGAEKVVRITVNGVEADFHMYLDNSGEAYFVREVELGAGSETNGNVGVTGEAISMVESNGGENSLIHRLEHSVSDSGVARMLEVSDSFDGERLQRAESDGDKRFYEFQDDQSLENSIEMSGYESNQYENIDGGRHVESQGSGSEVVLVSVDGHVLTAPVLSSEQDTEDVQLSTPQFHLGPGEESDFCEGSEEFNAGDDAWPDDYINNMNTSAADVKHDDVCSTNGNDVDSGHQLEVCEGEEEHNCAAHEGNNVSVTEGGLASSIVTKEGEKESVCQGEIQNIAIKEGEPNNIIETREIWNVVFEEGDLKTLSDASSYMKKDVFQSCLELTELDKHFVNADSDERGLSSEVHDSRDNSLENSPMADKAENGNAIYSHNGEVASSSSGDSPRQLVEGEQIENNVVNSTDQLANSNEIENIGLYLTRVDSDCKSVVSVTINSEQKNEQYDATPIVEEIDHGSERSVSDEECSKSAIAESPVDTTTAETPSPSFYSKEFLLVLATTILFMLLLYIFLFLMHLIYTINLCFINLYLQGLRSHYVGMNCMWVWARMLQMQSLKHIAYLKRNSEVVQHL